MFLQEHKPIHRSIQVQRMRLKPTVTILNRTSAVDYSHKAYNLTINDFDKELAHLKAAFEKGLDKILYQELMHRSKNEMNLGIMCF